MNEELAGARAILADAERVVVLTGAGISAESGVPTFRGQSGLWRSHRPEELATPEAFARDPLLVWTWYQWRREVVGACKPNPGHRALARACFRGGVRIVSQNVDGLHEQAAREEADGRDPSPALPMLLHGSLFGNRCRGCGQRTSGRMQVVDTSALAGLPRCEACSDLLRPDVVWFGEALDAKGLRDAFAAAAAADVCVLAGTSAVVHPAASVPLATLEAGGRLIEVNPDQTPLTRHCHAVLRGPSGTILPALFVS